MLNLILVIDDALAEGVDAERDKRRVADDDANACGRSAGKTTVIPGSSTVLPGLPSSLALPCPEMTVNVLT